MMALGLTVFYPIALLLTPPHEVSLEEPLAPSVLAAILLSPWTG